ncbi:MAG: BatA and WFA domain-containing protein [Phycisphaerales bacterium JB065]
MLFGLAPMLLLPTLAFQFLAPVAGLVGAGIAIPAFLFFYFLKLRRRPMRVSTTLFWEQAVSDLQVNAPFRWLKPSVLFFVQLLALLCLLTAIARPAIEGGMTSGRVILLIDASASMASRDDQNIQTRLELAKADAKALLESLPSEVEAMVISMASTPSTLTNFTRNRALARNAIDSLKQTDQPSRLSDALEVLAAFVSPDSENGPDSESSSPPPRVILFSDGAFPDPPEDRAVAGVAELEFEYRRFGPQLPKSAAESENGGPEFIRSPNIAIIGLSVRRDLEDPSLVRVFTRLQSTYPREKSVALRCSVNGETVAASSAVIDGTDGSATGAAEATFSFDLRNTDGGLLAVSVISEDAMDSDNRAWLMLAPPEPVRILMIRPDGSISNGTANLAFALETVFPPPQEVRVMTRQEAIDSGLIEGKADDGFDLVVYDSVTPPVAPEVPSLLFDAAPPLPGVSLSRSEQAGGSEFLFWRRSHPVMRDVVPDGVLIYRRSELAVDEDSASTGEMIVRSTELASEPKPLIALLEYARTRSVVVGFSLDQTNWWQDRSFPVFVQNSVDFLTAGSQEQAGRVITTSDPIRIAPSEAFGGATIVGADGSTLRVPAPATEEAVLVAPLPRAGVYELLPSDQSQLPSRLIPVSLLNPFESMAASAPTVEIAGRSVDRETGGGIARREIWDWFILAATALLVLEWLLFDRKMRV